MDKKKRTFGIIIAALLVVGSIGIGISQVDVGIQGTATGGDGSKGVYGEASNTGDVRNYGGFFVADGSFGRGVYGKASNIGDYTNYGGFFYASGTEGRGVFGQAAGSNGYGVKGWASNDGDVENYGGHFCAAGSKGIGVYGWAENTGDVKNYGGYFVANGSEGTGVYGRGSEGGYFTTTTAGTWDNLLAGVKVSTAYKSNPGVYVMTTGNLSDGVYTETTGNGSDGVCIKTAGEQSLGVSIENTGDYSHGVCVVTLGEGSPGVYSRTYRDGSRGVYSVTSGEDSEGVYIKTTGVGSEGVCAYSLKADGIYAETSRTDHKYGVNTPDKMRAMSYDTRSSDVAEYFAVDEDVEPGTVMVIDPVGGSKLRCSTKAYDTTVAGIVSTSPGMSLGINEEGNEGEKLIAVAGRVPCKVDASYAPIKPGDLLTTSDTPGYAMKATKPQIGTILGKALEPLDSGSGVIEVLVTLQ